MTESVGTYCIISPQFEILSFKSGGSAATEQVNSVCCSDGKLHLETCLFSDCASNLNPATTASLDLIQKEKQRSRAHWRVTAFSYLMFGPVWNQSLKPSLQEVLWLQSHSLVMTAFNCLQKLNQSELTLPLLPINGHWVWNPNLFELIGTS